MKLRSNLDEICMQPRWNLDETDMGLRCYLDAAWMQSNADAI